MLGISISQLITQANAHFLAQRYIEALELYRQLVLSMPDDAHIQTNLATTLMQLGQLEEARQHFDIALMLYPQNPAALNNLAALLGRLNEKKEALARLKQLHQLIPQDPVTLSNIGAALSRLNQNVEALDWFDQALILSPKFADAHYGKAVALSHLGQEKNSKVHCKYAVQYQPQDPKFRLLKLMLTLPSVATNSNEVRNGVDKFQQEIIKLKKWVNQNDFRLESLGEQVGDRQPFALAYRLGNLVAALSEYGDLMAKAAYAYWHRRGLVPVPLPEPRARIRLAILNAQIRRHSVWDIILKGIVKHLDRRNFELVLYHTGAHIDEETKWAESVADKFVQGPKGHAEWLAQIREDRPDVLFLPEIGMDPLTCKLAALRLAPLQVASWGHPVTTGFPEIDLYLSGELIEGSNADTHYCEKLIRLPNTGACTEPLPNPALPVPAELLALPEDRSWVRMVICQRPFKLDPSFDSMLAQAIKASWPCKLYLLKDTQWPWASERVYARLKKALSKVGISAEKCLVEVPWLSREQFFGLLDEMDIYLDMPAFSGYTTAWQATHRGIPIVTLEGKFMRQRLAAGLLRKIEQTQTIASTSEAYVQIVAKLAQECRDPEQKMKRRQELQVSAPKADHDVSVVRAFEKTLIDALAEKGKTFSGLPNLELPMQPTQETKYPWQMLHADLHLTTLKSDYAPVGLLQMIETPPKNILDVGCFCGGSGRWLKNKFPAVKVLGIEMLEKAAEIARQFYDQVLVGKFEDHDLTEYQGKFDAIIAADVLEHMYDPWQVLQKLKPLLAPGGAIYISLPNIRNLNVLQALAKGEWQYEGAGILDITHIRFFTKKQALQMLEQTGWKPTEVRINPDPRLAPAFEGKDLSQIQNIEANGITLTGLDRNDVLELMALQLFICAIPACNEE